MTEYRARELANGAIVYVIDRWATRGLESFVIDSPRTGILGNRSNAWYAASGGPNLEPGFRIMGTQTPEDDTDHGRFVLLTDAFTDHVEAATESRRRIRAAIDELESAHLRSFVTPLPPILMLRDVMPQAYDA